MNKVVVIFLDGKEVLFENAIFEVITDTKLVKIMTPTYRVIGVFNFDNIAGVRTI